MDNLFKSMLVVLKAMFPLVGIACIAVGLMLYSIGSAIIDQAAWLIGANEALQSFVDWATRRLKLGPRIRRWFWKIGERMYERATKEIVLKPDDEDRRQQALMRLSQLRSQDCAAALDKVKKDESIPSSTRNLAVAAKAEHEKLSHKATAGP